MKRLTVPLEEIYPLLPQLDELEELRRSIAGAATTDPAKEWARSSSYATIDKRIISLEQLEAVLQGAEAVLHRQVSSFFSGYRQLFQTFCDGDDIAAADCLIRLGEEEEEQGRYVRARQLFDAALRIALPLTDKRPQIVALRRVGRVLWRQSEFEEAYQYYSRSAELAGDAGDLHNHVIALTGSGNVRLFQGRYAEAERCYREALSRVEAVTDIDLQLERAQLYNNLGTTAMEQNRPEEADEWFEKALSLWEVIDSKNDLAICFHNLGLLRQRQGDLAQSRALLQQALALPIPAALSAAIAADLALAYLADGMVSQAERWGREAEQHAISAGSPYYLGRMYLVLGNIARAREDEGGITFFEKSLQIAREKAHPRLEGEVLLDYALLREQVGDVEEALSYILRAQKIFSELGAIHDEERARRELERVSRMQGAPMPGD